MKINYKYSEIIDIAVKCLEHGKDQYKTNSKENDDIQQEPIDNSEENITPEKTTTLYGDSNGDGKVDMSDAVLIMQMMANPNKFQVSPEFKENADVYQTGTGITTMDALSIQKYLLGLIPSLPEK